MRFRRLRSLCSKFLSTLSLRRATLVVSAFPTLVCRFLSTLSLRRATTHILAGMQVQTYFYPRSPCGERQVPGANSTATPSISIHALLAESDLANQDSEIVKAIFLSTLSLRRATAGGGVAHKRNTRFLSTLSLRRATRFRRVPQGLCEISIHALLAESDSWSVGKSSCSIYFYPRSPCGERLWRDGKRREYTPISIHALLAESDGQRKSLPGGLENFYPRSPCGERRCKQRFVCRQ